MHILRRVAATAILVSWMAPGAAAMAVGIHLLIDHHHVTAHADAAVSHHHDVIVSPGHDHEAVQSRRTSTFPPAIAAAAAPPPSRSCSTESEMPASRIISTAAPPGSLFLSHCSLLI